MTTSLLPTAAGLWYRDVISCLWATLAENVARAGADPLEVLGLHWEFRFRPGDVRSEEFYFPGAYPDDVARSIAPYHGISSRWHRAADDENPLAELAGLTGRGVLPVAAVDNFHLPFRPAFGDVHAAHLIVVHDVDPVAGTVTVSDAMPPAFSGVIDAAAFRSSWESANPSDEQDAFFSDSRIDRRYLTVTVDELPPLGPELLKRVLETDGKRFAEGDERGPSGDWTGLPGLSRFLTDLTERAAAGDPGALRDAYPFGWGMQAQAGLHGELLRRLGARHDIPELREAGRRVEAVAHAWTGVRLCSAHGHPDPLAALAELRGHASRLEEAYHRGVAAVNDAWRAL